MVQEPLTQSDKLKMDIELTEASMDGFIDDIITITIDDPNWVELTKKSALLVIHTIFHPTQALDPLTQDDPLPIGILAGEGQLEERKTLLGWDIHTLSLRVFEIRTDLYPVKIKTETQESLIGKLNHALHEISPAWYLLNQLHQMIKQGNKWAQSTYNTGTDRTSTSR